MRSLYHKSQSQYRYILTLDLSQVIALRDEGGCPRGSGGGRTALTETLPAGDYVAVIEGFGDETSPYRREGAYVEFKSTNYSLSSHCRYHIIHLIY